MIRVEIEGDKEISRALRRIATAAQKAAFIGEATEEAFERSLHYIKPHTKSGTMEDSLDHRVRGHEGRVFFSPNVPYAVYVHFGTRKHIIQPKKRKALRFETPSGFAFAKRVEHPGYKGDPFFKKAADDTFKKLGDIIERSMNAAL